MSTRVLQRRDTELLHGGEEHKGRDLHQHRGVQLQEGEDNQESMTTVAKRTKAGLSQIGNFLLFIF